MARKRVISCSDKVSAVSPTDCAKASCATKAQPTNKSFITIDLH